MKKHLINLVREMQRVQDDKYNPETYFNNNINASEGMLKSQYVLGSLYANGYVNNRGVNFQIFKDQSTWQIWVWKFDEEKKEMNQFNSPYYHYDEVINFINNNL